MVTKRLLVFVSLILAVLFHFLFYLNYYGPSISSLQGVLKYLLALGSAIIIVFLYFTTYWRADLKRSKLTVLFDILILWFFISLIRSILEIRDLSGFISFIFNNYLALTCFPLLFFIVGINPNYFHMTNRILFIYVVLAFLFSLPFINFFELQLYLAYPLFFIILTIPLRRSADKILILIISITVIVVSLTNRAGILRILFSFCIVGVYFIMKKVHINKKLLYALVFIVLMIPLASLYLAIKGQSVFQIILGDDDTPYSQLNPYADTRTFLYYEVFQDLKTNDVLLFGKGFNAGYDSPSFHTYRREVVEVGFLQILMKTGIVGFILYFSVIVVGIFKSIGHSNNLFLKMLGFLLIGYIIMLFFENQLAYNLLNIIIWLVVGMCYSPVLRGLNDKEIGVLFHNSNKNN